jgi:hypothetical protein
MCGLAAARALPPTAATALASLALNSRIVRSTEQLAYLVDDTRLPLLALRPTAAVDDPAALDGTYRALEQVLAKRRRILMLFDLRGASSSPGRRRRLLDWGLRHEPELRAHVGACALVVSNGIERGFVTAMLWLHPVPWPMRVFSSVGEAEAWLLRDNAENRSNVAG